MLVTVVGLNSLRLQSITRYTKQRVDVFELQATKLIIKITIGKQTDTGNVTMTPFENTYSYDDADMVGLMGRLVLSEDEHNDEEDFNENESIPLPLTGVSVDAEVVDFIAEVKLSQCYQNNQSRPIETTYHFPVDQAASVCALKAEYEDGSVVYGKIEEKLKARETYEQAKRQGKQANLLESAKRDILILKVGNLAPGQYIKITVTYVTSLKAQEDAAAFILPTCIAPRYIPPPSPKDDLMTPELKEAVAPPYSTAVKLVGIDIGVKFQCHSEIKTIACPTHSNDTPFTSQIDGKTGAVAFRDIAMDRDLVVLVTEEQPHQPRAGIEVDDDGNLAGFVTLFPQIEFQDIPREFIFLVDRSGSMNWSRHSGSSRKSQIDQAGDALLLLLRSLPPSCTFNIVGFGSHFTPLFESSRSYNDDSLGEASNYASNMKADFGGTNIKAPLEYILNDEGKTSSLFGGRLGTTAMERQVFVLTDGQVSNDKEVFDVIDRHCNNSNQNTTKCRVFTLGIGSGVSRHLVEGMARAGRGTARFVEGGDAKSLRVNVLDQLKKALQPALEDVSIEWKFPVSEQPVAKKPKSDKPQAAIKTLLGYRSPVIDEEQKSEAAEVHSSPQMFPTVPPPVFNKERFLSFAMFDGKEIPESVTVKCNSPDGALEVSLKISKEDDVYQGSIAHRLAARAAITEYEDSAMRSHRYDDCYDTPYSVSKTDALELALKHKLVSQQTSFIAVLEKAVVAPGTEATKEIIPQCLPNYEDAKDARDGARRRASSASPQMLMAAPSACAAAPRGRGSTMGRVPDWGESPQLSKSKGLFANPKRNMDEGAIEFTRSVGGQATPAMVAPFMSMSMLSGGLVPAKASYKKEMSCEVKRSAKVCRKLKKSDARRAATSSRGAMENTANRSEEMNAIQSEDDPLLRLCVLQKSDGKFLLGHDLAAALGLSMEGIERIAKKEEFQYLSSKSVEVFATILAVASMRARFATSKDVWELQEQKAMAYLASHGVIDADVLAVGKSLL